MLVDMYLQSENTAKKTPFPIPFPHQQMKNKENLEKKRSCIIHKLPPHPLTKMYNAYPLRVYPDNPAASSVYPSPQAAVTVIPEK
jgi:hypothetical protein